jgi:hypothetical protein
MFWRRKVEWRMEPGPGYELRQYQGRRPTGLVAVMGWDNGDNARPVGATGPDVRMTRQYSRLVIEEHRHRPGGTAVRMQVPLQSCVDAQLAAEPGLPGTALSRFTLTVRLGTQSPFSVSLWFPSTCHPFLQSIVNEIKAAQQTMRRTPLLEVGQAPQDGDWVVFRPADDAGVVRRRPVAGTRRGDRL